MTTFSRSPATVDSLSDLLHAGCWGWWPTFLTHSVVVLLVWKTALFTLGLLIIIM